MAEPNEPFSVYGLMFPDNSLNWTIGEISAALTPISDGTLFEAAGLATILVTSFQQAFGPDDIRYNAPATAVAALGSELERRGYQVAAGFNPEAAFDGWRAAVATGRSDIEVVPARRLSLMRLTVKDALARLGPGGPPDVLERLCQVLATVDPILLRRELGGPVGGFQA